VLPSVQADVLLTDPPYGIGRLMQGGTNTGHWNLLSSGNAWDMDAADLTILDLTKPSIVWGGNYFTLPLSRCWLAWVKTNAVETMADMELAWTNIDRPSRVRYLPSGGAYERLHPTQKPLELFLWCLSFFPDGILVDPFLGSGTSLVAAKQVNRKAIGIEFNEAYCEIAAKRLSQEVFNFAEALPADARTDRSGLLIEE
jgi:DNA modification methylase